MDGVSFVRKEKLRPTGTIIEAKGPGQMLGTGDVVYIRDHTKGTMAPGSRYTALRLMDPVEGLKTREYFGIQYTPTGVVEIMTKKDGFVLARVIDSYRTMQAGDIAIPFKKRSRKILLTESPDGLVGRVIGSVDHDILIGDKTIAFIDKGKQDGVKPGQEFVVFYREKYPLHPNRTWKSALLPDVEFGTIIVLHTEKESATVLITRAQESLIPGVAFRTPTNASDPMAQ